MHVNLDIKTNEIIDFKIILSLGSLKKGLLATRNRKT